MATDATILPRFAEGQFRGVVTASKIVDLTTGETYTIAELAAGSSGGGTVTSAQITDATTVGKAVLVAANAGAARTAIGATTVGSGVLTATDAAAARTAIGAGTSNVVIGTGATQAMAGNTVIPPAYTLPNATTTVRGGVLQAATQAASVATDVAGVVADLNALIAKLKTSGAVA